MVYTGQELYKLLQQQVDQAYSGYLDTFKGDRIFKQAYIEALSLNYKRQQGQDAKDNTTTLTKTNVVIIPNNNTINTQPLQITFVGIVSGTVYLIHTFLSHNLTTGQTVTISGVLGTVSANGTFTVTVTGPNEFQINVGLTGGSYTVNSGIVLTKSTLPDYWHSLATKCKFIQPVYGYTVTDASNTSPIVIKLDKRNSFRSGEWITISGISGNTAANGIFYVKKLNSFTFALFQDQNLQFPVTGNGIYSSGGTLSRIFYEYTFNYVSEQKTSVITTPATNLPAVEIANNQIKIYPLDITCTEVTIDYISKPPVYITCTDNTIDMGLYFPDNFLLFVVSMAAEIFAKQVRDIELVQMEQGEKAKDA